MDGVQHEGSARSGANEASGIGSSERALFPADDRREALSNGLEVTLSVLFGVGAWLTVNGVFVELPLLVRVAPESWTLASHLSLAVQVANAGPILYLILLRCSAKARTFAARAGVIYCVLLMGALACLALAFTWDKPIEGRSWPTLILTFVFALVGCTSSVLFIPFMTSFRPRSLAAYFTGEGVGGLLPGAIALAQGVGGESTCGADGKPIPPPPPRFSPQVFYLCLCILMVLSTLAFAVLERKGRMRKSDASKEEKRSGLTSYETEPESRTPEAPLSTCQLASLLGIAAWVCLLANGALPGIQTYSCGPYGNVAFHLCATLSAMANPATCLLVFFTRLRKTFSLNNSFAMIFNILGSFALVTTVLSGLAFTTAALSPKPPLVGTTAGEILIVLIWIGLTVGAVYAKVGVAGALQEADSLGRGKISGRGPLLWYGALTQAGSALGSLVSFLLVSEWHLFTAYSPC